MPFLVTFVIVEGTGAGFTSVKTHALYAGFCCIFATCAALNVRFDFQPLTRLRAVYRFSLLIARSFARPLYGCFARVLYFQALRYGGFLVHGIAHILVLLHLFR